MYEIILGRGVKDREKFGTLGSVFLGKQYVQMGKTLSLSTPIYLDAIRTHVVLVSGKRGGGKSYTLSVIVEGLLGLPPEISSRITCVIFDTMGIFWTMKYPNYKEDKILAEWGLVPRSLQPRIFVPFGLFDKYQSMGIPADIPFAINPSEVSASQWTELFGTNLLSDEGVLIERVINKLRDEGGSFGIDDIIEQIEKENIDDKIKEVLKNRFYAVKGWGVFSENATRIEELLKGGEASIIDLSAYSNSDEDVIAKALIIGIICKKIFSSRVFARRGEEVSLVSSGGFLGGGEGSEMPLVWVFIDEAHEFLPDRGKTLASGALIQMLREGRQPGISMVLATQQPGKIHSDVITQADIVISHRLTAKIDLEALRAVMQSYLPFPIDRYMDELPRSAGAALTLDDNNEKLYSIQVRPRFSWHGGEDPSAITQNKELGFVEKVGEE